MKAIFLAISLVFLFAVGVGVLAQATELPDPGLTPDSKLYFLERIGESIRIFFTFGDLKKAERYANLAAERLAEAKAVVEKGKSDLAEKTLKRYQEHLAKSIARAEKAQSKGKNIEKVMAVITKVGQATTKHLEVLAEVYQKVPESVKPAIENAMKVSVKGHERAVEALKARGSLGEVPEEAPLPVQMPQQVRERIRLRAQQELEIEEALESPESLKNLCIEAGGPAEGCEEIASQQFESFGELEDFCKERGGPSEICSGLKDRCKEAGVSTPNKCFLYISIYNLKAFRETSLGVEMVPTVPERFETFEQLEAFCLEQGTPPEQCAALEATCKKAGAATADQCYRGVDSEGRLIHPMEFYPQ